MLKVNIHVNGQYICVKVNIPVLKVNIHVYGQYPCVKGQFTCVKGQYHCVLSVNIRD